MNLMKLLLKLYILIISLVGMLIIFAGISNLLFENTFEPLYTSLPIGILVIYSANIDYTRNRTRTSIV